MKFGACDFDLEASRSGSLGPVCDLEVSIRLPETENSLKTPPIMYLPMLLRNSCALLNAKR